MVYQVYIYLASDEWGNDTMRRIADEYARHHADARLSWPCMNTRGGVFPIYMVRWHCRGAICGTANDSAVLPQAVLDFGRTIDKVTPLGEIRR